MAPGPLAQVLRQLPKNTDPNLLTADIPFADAGVYRLADNCALVQSIDFFTPVVDDPRTFGRIAAANALSDVYAMGGKPLTVLNLVGFPRCLPREVLVEILQGSAEVVAAAGATVVGGHTVDDDEPKFGLAVTGLVDPGKMLTTAGAQPGDLLYLTKPLGTGILTTALKGEVLTEAQMADAIAGMSQLNKDAAAAMLGIGVHACTDITGFGLLGHAVELAVASKVGVVIEVAKLPIYPGAYEMAQIGLVPEGSYNNRSHYLPHVEQAETVNVDHLDLLADPQTSGGLLMAVAAERAALLEKALLAAGAGAWQVGAVCADHPGRLRIES